LVIFGLSEISVAVYIKAGCREAAVEALKLAARNPLTTIGLVVSPGHIVLFHGVDAVFSDDSD